MRHGLLLAALLLPLSGCYVPPQNVGYGYAQPGYPPGAGYGYQPDQGDPDAYPGYSYNDGAPTLMVDGSVMPLVLFGGGWGYYDREHNFHHAPDRVEHRLEQQRESGGGFHPGGGGGYPQGRPEGRPDPYRGQANFRPAEPPRAAPPAPAAQPYRGVQGLFRPAEPPRAAPPAPAAQPYRGVQGLFRPAEPQRPMPAAAARPPQAAQPEHQDRHRECPPGQHC